MPDPTPADVAAAEKYADDEALSRMGDRWYFKKDYLTGVMAERERIAAGYDAAAAAYENDPAHSAGQRLAKRYRGLAVDVRRGPQQ